jgi:integrase/recombinase XerC
LPASLAWAHPQVAGLVHAWLDWLAHQKRQSAATVKAYRTDLFAFLHFCAEHLGEPPDLGALLALSAADFRAWLAARHRRGLARRSTARALAAVRSFYRFLGSMAGTIRPPQPCARRASSSACRAPCRRRTSPRCSTIRPRWTSRPG